MFTLSRKMTHPVTLEGAAPTPIGLVTFGSAHVNSERWPWSAGFDHQGQLVWQRAQRPPHGDASHVGGAPRDNGTVMTLATREQAKIKRLLLRTLGSTGQSLAVSQYGALNLSMTAASHRPLIASGSSMCAMATNATDGKVTFAWLTRSDAWGKSSCNASGGCESKTPKGCADSNPCTMDMCDAKAGCKNVPVTDGTACGAAKTCVAGSCVNNPQGMVYVPAGTFWMGCNSANGNACEVDEKPQHSVSVSAFWIDRSEVTRGAYQSFQKTSACSGGVCAPRTAKLCNPAGEPSSSPINCVSHAAAAAYCQQQGKRLPSEAEWEKAARGGCDVHGLACKTAATAYLWGTKPPSCSSAQVSMASVDKGVAQPACGAGWMGPVGQHPADVSPYGALDMAGSVAEWVGDWYSASTYATQDGASSPKGPSSGAQRVARGGAFTDADGKMFRTTGRRAASPGPAVGFRCVKAQ